MNPDEQALKNRLNPTPVTFQLPSTEGLFRGSGDYGTTLYRKAGNKVEAINLIDLLVPQNERQNIGNSGAQASTALQRLKDTYGLDYNSLSQVNIGDLQSQGHNQGLQLYRKAGPEGGPDNFINPYTGDLTSFLGAKQNVATSPVTVNNTPNALTPMTPEIQASLQPKGPVQATGQQPLAGQNMLQNNAGMAMMPGGATPIQTSSYTGPSIVDYLASVGQANDFASRKELANKMGIANYTGTANQNTELLSKLRSGQQATVGNNPTIAGGAAEAQPFALQSLQDLGVTPSASKNPLVAFAETYQQLYSSMGLPTAKAEIEKLQKSYSDLVDEEAEEISEINANPWYSEAKRSKEIQNIQSKFEGKKKGVSEQLSLFEKSFDDARDEAQFIAKSYLDTVHQNAVLDQQLLLKKMDLAEKAASANDTTDLKEYEYAKAQGYKGSFVEFQREMANLKAKASGAGALTSAQLNSTINQIAGSFDNDPAVKKFLQVQSAYQSSSGIPTSNRTPANDISLIYAFAKSQDPESVVREGEYATIQKYAQSWAQQFGFSAARIFTNTKFLSDDAVANIKAAISAKYLNEKKNYDNVYNEYNRRINDVKGGGLNSITNYDTPNTAPTTGAINGQTKSGIKWSVEQ